MDKEEVTRRRKALGLSMSKLSHESGLHLSTISAIENGRLVPYPSQAEKLRAAFERLEAVSGRKV